MYMCRLSRNGFNYEHFPLTAAYYTLKLLKLLTIVVSLKRNIFKKNKRKNFLRRRGWGVCGFIEYFQVHRCARWPTHIILCPLQKKFT